MRHRISIVPCATTLFLAAALFLLFASALLWLFITFIVFVVAPAAAQTLTWTTAVCTIPTVTRALFCPINGILNCCNIYASVEFSV
jgi:hypothetical protein